MVRWKNDFGVVGLVIIFGCNFILYIYLTYEYCNSRNRLCRPGNGNLLC